jgi:hypothetical protein
MQYLFFFAILLFYIYRTFSQAQKKAKEDAARRRQTNEQQPQQPVPSNQPKTLQEVLTDVFRETEMKTKPYGDGRKLPPVTQPKKVYPQPVQKPFQQTRTATATVKTDIGKKKEAQPFLSVDYTPEPLPKEGASTGSMEDFIKHTQVSDAYLISGQGKRRINFNIRDAVIAKIILDRPEW